MSPVPNGAATRHLAAADPDMAALVARIGPCTLAPETGREPYEALVRAVAHQQLHGRAAEAILARMIGLCAAPFPTPGWLLAAEEAALRGCGFSAGKAATLRGIARAAADGTIPGRDEAEAMEDEALVARLTALRGIGRWTVEMLLIFTLGRPDILPVDDFGVREGWRVIKRLPIQPRPKALAETGLAFAPYRSTAAWYLWRAADGAKAEKTIKTTQYQLMESNLD